MNFWIIWRYGAELTLIIIAVVFAAKFMAPELVIRGGHVKSQDWQLPLSFRRCLVPQAPLQPWECRPKDPTGQGKLRIIA